MPIIQTLGLSKSQRSGTPAAVNSCGSIDPSLRVAHGFRELHIGNDANIRVKSTIDSLSKTHTTFNLATGEDTKLYSAISDAFIVPTSDWDFITGTHTRNLLLDPQAPASVRINFINRLPAPPRLVVFFSGIDLDKDHGWRLKTSVTDVDREGFTLNIETWSDTVLFAAEVTWIAYAAKRSHIYSTSVNTTDVRPYHAPQLQHDQVIAFPSVGFANPPSIFVALNFIDIDCKADFRVRVYVDGVSTTALTWHIDTWGDSVLYAAGASVIAFT